MTDTTASPAATQAGPNNTLLLLLKARTFIALILVFVFFSIFAPNFLSTANMVIMSKHVALNAFLAIGMTFVIVSGGIDLSVGSIVGLCGMVAGYLLLNGIDIGLGWSVQFNTLEICLIVALVGIAIGALNAFLVTKLNVAPFIATLGTLYIARGAAMLSSEGETFPNLTGNAEYGSQTYRMIGSGEFLGIPVSIWMLIAVGLLAAYIAKRTPLGRFIYAVGGNERAAGLSGVKVTRVKYFVYMFSGFCAALVGENDEMYEQMVSSCEANLATIRDPDLRRRLTPDYRVGCKRLIVSDRFYDALQQPNAHLVTENIARIEAKGVRTSDGVLHELDCLIYATGFDTHRFFRPMEVVGAGGRTLDEAWSDGNEGYGTVSIPGFPNWFMIGGPNSPIGNFSFIMTAEHQFNYILQLIEVLRSGRAKEIAPRREAADAFNARIREAMKSSVWASGCSSWYLDKNGRVASWPWSYEGFRAQMAQPNWEDFDLL